MSDAVTRPPAIGRLARRYALPYAHWYAGGALALLLTNGMSVTIPLYLATGIDALALGAAGRPIVARSALIVAGMGVLVIGARTASRLLFFNPGRKIEAKLTVDLFASLVRQQSGFFAAHPQGDLQARFTSDIQYVRLMFGFAALGLVNTVVAAVMATGQLLKLSPALGALAALPLGLGFLATSIAVDRMRDLMRQNQIAMSAMSEHALTSFQGIAAVHAFDAAPVLEARFLERNVEIQRNQLARSGLRVAVGPLLGLAASIDVFLALWLGGGGHGLSGAIAQMSAGEIVAFAAIVAYLVAPLRQFTFTWSVVRQATASLERITEVLDAVPLRPDLPSPRPVPTAAPSIAVRGLTFRYPGADRDALHDVSIDVPAGGLLGVFGPTGSGKTTFVRCLLRLEDPPAGAIEVDGVDVRELDLDGWRKAAVLVPQRAFLFSESVRSNIALGSMSGGAPVQVEPVVRDAQLDVDIAALPDGLDTVVGEAGLTLSGGQRQRVALARGLARDGVVLALDDVLSAVDPATESALLRTLSKRGVGTRVIVSNRVSALRHADVIVVLDGGRAVDRGTHAALSARSGSYREACLRQEEGR